MRGLREWDATDGRRRVGVVDLARDNWRDWTLRGLRRRKGSLRLKKEATTGRGISPVREVPCPTRVVAAEEGPFLDSTGDDDGGSILLFYRTGTSQQRCRRATWRRYYGAGPIPLRPVERSAESFCLQVKVVLSEDKQGGEA